MTLYPEQPPPPHLPVIVLEDLPEKKKNITENKTINVLVLFSVCAYGEGALHQ